MNDASEMALAVQRAIGAERKDLPIELARDENKQYRRQCTTDEALRALGDYAKGQAKEVERLRPLAVAVRERDAELARRPTMEQVLRACSMYAGAARIMDDLPKIMAMDAAAISTDPETCEKVIDLMAALKFSLAHRAP